MTKEKAKRIVRGQFTGKEKKWGERILSSLMIPILIFNLCSSYFFLLGAKTAFAADGSGHMTIDKDTVAAGGTQTYKLTFDPTESMDGGEVKVAVPTGWTPPTGGNVSLTAVGGATFGALDFSGQDITVPITSMASNQGFYLTLTNFVASASSGTATFTTRTQISGGGSLRTIGDSPTVDVTAGLIDHYEISTISNQTAGVDFNITITAKDANENTTTGSATVALTVQTGTGNLVGDTSADTSTDGTDTITLHYDTPENNVVLKASDGTPARDDNSNTFNVQNISAPSLSTPANNAYTNDPTPAFDWSTVSGSGITYTLEVDSANTFDTSNKLTKTGLASSNYTLDGSESLGNDGSYYWRVKAIDSYSNDSGWSATRTFDYQTSPPDSPNGSFVKSGASNPENYINKYTASSATVTVSVDGADTIDDGSTVYVRLSDGTNTATGSQAYSGAGTTSVDVTGINANSLFSGNITVSARIVDRFGNQNNGGYVTGTSATKDITPAGIPNLTAEPDTNNARPTIEWSSVSGANKYEIQIDSEAVVEIPSGTSYNPGSDLGQGSRTWKVRTVDTAWNKSNWSSTDTFIVDSVEPISSVSNTGAYSASSWAAGPVSGNIYGTASDATTSVDFVDITIQRSSDSQYYNGTGWGAGATWLRATGTTSWTYAFSPADGETYTVQSRATDTATNVETTYGSNSFSYDSTGPSVGFTDDVSAAATTSDSISITATDAALNAGSLKYKFVEDPFTCNGTVDFTGAPAYTSATPFNITDESNNGKKICAKASDNAGNTSYVLSANALNIDVTAPVISSISMPAGTYKIWDTFNVTVTADAPGYTVVSATVNGVDVLDTLVDNGDGTYTFEYEVVEGDPDVAAGAVPTASVVMKDSLNNTSAAYTTVTENGGNVIIDGHRPELTSVSISSNNADQAFAKTGDTVTLSFTSNETIQANPTVDISSGGGPVAGPVTVTNTGGNNWTATYDVNALDTDGNVTFSISFSDSAGNSMTSAVTDVTDATSVIVDKTAPVLAVTAPNGGEYISGGASYTITWDTTDDNSDIVAIDYSTNGGGAWNAINLGGDTADDGTFTWTVPAVDSSNVLVRVTATDSAGNTGNDSSDAVFTVDNTNPVVAVTSPNGSEVWAGGSTHAITWTTTEANPDTVAIYYSTNGVDWTAINLGGDTADDGTFNWTVPSIDSGTVTVKVVATDDTDRTGEDVSDANFAIDSSAPTVAVTSPNGGEYWQGGSNHNITWTATDAHISGTPITLEYSTNGTDWNLIANNEANDGSYAWNPLPGIDSGTVKVRVTAVDDLSHSANDLSDANFTIDNTNPSVSVTSPNGGEFWSGGSTHNITWTTTETNKGTVGIEYSNNNGGAWNAINLGGDTADDGTFAWTVPAEDSGNMLVRVTATDLSARTGTDDSNAVFTVDNTNPVVAVTSPNGSEVWAGGSTHAITWNSTENNKDVVAISYSTNGTDWTSIDVSGDNTDDGTFNWTVPLIDSNTVTIKVVATDKVSRTGQDVSDANFTIDSTKPSSTVSTTGQLTDNEYTVVSGGRIRGAHSDNLSTVNQVRITIQRSSDSQYYNGAGGWVAGATWLTANLDGGEWNYIFTPADGETYAIQSEARDGASNFQTSYGTGSFTYDATNPASASTIASASYGPNTWTAAGTINGTASDATTGIAGVTITIQRDSDSNYWNGTAWQAGSANLAASGTTSWTYNLASDNLTDGVTYTVAPTATDGAGNSVAGTSDSFSYDSSVATPTLNLDAGATYSLDQTVDVAIGNDGEANAWYLSENSSAPAYNAVGWDSEPATFSLSGGDGAKTVYVFIKDSNQNVSASGNDSITLDTTRPSISRSAIESTGSNAPGYLYQGDTYYAYAQVADATSGVNTVTANLANITAGQTAVAMASAGGPWTVGGNSYNYRSAQKTVDNPLAEGVKSFTIDSTDQAGNNANQHNGSATVDNSTANDPSVTVYESSSKNSSLSTDTWYNYSAPYAEWSAPNDNPGGAPSGIAGYYICVDSTNSCNPNVDGAFQTTTDYTFAGLANGNTYYLRMEVEDNAGNLSTAAGEMFVYKFDSENPDAGGASITDDGTWTNSTTALNANWAGFTDNSGSIALYQYSIGTSVGNTSVRGWTDNGTNTTVAAATLTLNSGTTYYFNVRAKDEAGNTSNVVSSNGITVDSQAPQGTVASSPSYSNTTFTVSWSGSSDVGPSGLNGHYKIKYKDQSDGAWTDWLADTTLANSTFGAGDSPVALISGHTYYVEAGAEDNATNWESFAGASGEDATIYDTDAPNNPTVSGYKTSAKTTSLVTNNWYNYGTPYFEWSAPQDLPAGAGLANSGIEGYYTYFGTNAAADPATDGNWQTTTNYPVATAMTSGQTYYMIMKTKDNAGNISGASTVFTYKYDTNAPDNPSVPVSGWSDSGKATGITNQTWYNYTAPHFEWAAPSDNPGGANAGVRGYYKGQSTNSSYNPTGNFNSNTYYTFNALSTSGVYYLRLKTADNADLNSNPSEVGNTSSAVTGFEYRFDSQAPTASITGITPIYDSTSDYIKGNFTVSGTAADTGGSGIGRVDVKIIDSNTAEYWNGAAWQVGEVWVTATGTTSWSYATSGLDLTGRTGHTITVQAKAYDSVNGGGTNGNNGTSGTSSVVVDTAQPSFGTNGTAATGTTGESFTFTQDVTDSGSGLSYVRVEYWFGTGAHSETAMTNSGGNTYTLGISIPSDSTDTLHYIFKSQDNVGNAEATTGQVDVTITDNDDPFVNVTTGNTTATAGGTKTISVDITDNIGVSGATLHYKNYGGNWNTKSMDRNDGSVQDGTWQSTIDVQQSSSSDMTYYVTAEDDAANADSADGDENGDEFSIDVSAGALDHYELYTDSDPITASAGTPFIFTIIAKDEFNNSKNNNSTANFTVKGWNGSSYIALTNYTLSPASITFNNNALKSVTMTLTGSGLTNYTSIQIVADNGSGVTGTINVGASGFSATAGIFSGNSGDGNVIDEGAGQPAEGSEGGQVKGAEDNGVPVVSDEGAKSEESAPTPFQRALPYVEGIGLTALLGSGIWWWIRRGGQGLGGGPGIIGILFSFLRTAAIKVRMFLW